MAKLRKKNPTKAAGCKCASLTLAGKACKGNAVGRSKFCMAHSKKRKSKKAKRKKNPCGSKKKPAKKRSSRARKKNMRRKLKKNPVVPVYLASHGKGEPRMVNVPDDTDEGDLLDQTFHYGQNEFQPQTAPSVSVGDVIRLPDGSLHRVMFAGFRRLPEGYNPLTLTGQDAWKDGYNFGTPFRRRMRRRNPAPWGGSAWASHMSSPPEALDGPATSLNTSMTEHFLGPM